MPIYHRLGKIPDKRHTTFHNKEKSSLYQEELFGTVGFSGMSSLLYHIHPPTSVKEKRKTFSVQPKIGLEDNLTKLSFKGFDINPEADYIKSRKTLFVNNDLHIGLASPSNSMEDYFFKNSEADEMLFVHLGTGTLHTPYGSISFKYGDYLIIPRGTIYQLKFDSPTTRLLFVESFSPILTPKKYRNNFGQLLEQSPFCERDYKLPQNLKTFDKEGDFTIMIKKNGLIYPYVYQYHPFDLVGWDGYNFPYAISIFDFEPITGRIHQPPPVHQQFEGHNFVICSFVPRMYDYHPSAIPSPYHHSNIDSDELLYYVDGDFMSRNSSEKGQITLHPRGIAHGPHPGAIQRSIGLKSTNELAVMIDPFNSLKITKEALNIEIKDYYKSWIH